MTRNCLLPNKISKVLRLNNDRGTCKGMGISETWQSMSRQACPEG